MTLENDVVVDNYLLNAVVMQITSLKSVKKHCKIGLSDMCMPSLRKYVDTHFSFTESELIS
jgi:hypothetical protein